MFAEAFSCVKDAATELLRIWECLYNYFILKRTRSVILSNLQTDNSIHVTTPDNGRVALRLLYKSKRNSIRLLQNSVSFKLEDATNRIARKFLYQQVISHHHYNSIYFSGSK